MNHDIILAVLPSSKDDAKSLKEIAKEMGLDITVNGKPKFPNSGIVISSDLHKTLHYALPRISTLRSLAEPIHDVCVP